MIWEFLVDYYVLALLIFALFLLRGVPAPVAIIVGGAFALVTTIAAWIVG